MKEGLKLGEYRTDGRAYKTRGGRDIVRVNPGKSHRFYVLSSTLVACTTHWVGNRTAFCPGLAQGCEHCKAGVKCRWEGWLAVVRPPHEKVLYLSITPGAAGECPRIEDREKTLRGSEVIVWRHGVTANSLMGLAIQPRLTGLLHIPDAPDVCGWVERLWALPAGCLARHPMPDDEVDLSDLGPQRASEGQIKKFIAEMKNTMGGAR